MSHNMGPAPMGIFWPTERDYYKKITELNRSFIWQDSREDQRVFNKSYQIISSLADVKTLFKARCAMNL